MDGCYSWSKIVHVTNSCCVRLIWFRIHSTPWNLELMKSQVSFMIEGAYNMLSTVQTNVFSEYVWKEKWRSTTRSTFFLLVQHPRHYLFSICNCNLQLMPFSRQVRQRDIALYQEDKSKWGERLRYFLLFAHPFQEKTAVLYSWRWFKAVNPKESSRCLIVQVAEKCKILDSHHKHVEDLWWVGFANFGNNPQDP